MVVRILVLLVALTTTLSARASELTPLKYNNPGLVVDLGVGLWAWPLPMDYDGDGDLDLIVSCPDKPQNGTFFFENPGKGESADKFPVFKAGVRVGPALKNAQLSMVDGKPRVLVPGNEVIDFRASSFAKQRKIYHRDNVHANKVRANQWRYVDFDADGALDLVVGIEDWTEYGWDNAYNPDGIWRNGPLHGHVYLLRNAATSDSPKYEQPLKVMAAGKPIDVFGMPSPSFADFDRDGDLDLVCGEFLDSFTYFENVGTRKAPEYALGRQLARDGQSVKMDLQMITPVAIDWDRDGDEDLIVGDEDGRVALVENTGELIDKVPQFLPPRYFRQEAEYVKFGALVTPVGFDWDGDGDDDFVCGNTAGRIGFIENLGGNPPKWAAPKLLEADGQTIRIMAGPNGSIQGPAEAKWGYTSLDVADWNHDELPDLMVNTIWGKIVWFQNVGTRKMARLTAARPIEVDWPSHPPKPRWTWWAPQASELVTQWRTSPRVLDHNGDGLNDLVVLDPEGYLACFERERVAGQLRLQPGKRVFVGESGEPLQLNTNSGGRSGRRQVCFADWNGDKQLDLLLDGKNADVLIRVGAEGDKPIRFAKPAPLDNRLLAGHTTSPTTVDWDRNGVPDLVVGAEDGFLYYLPNSREK